MADTQQVDPKAEQKAARLAQQISSFAEAHGGAEGQVAYLGQRGARIVLVGGDGDWGDLVAPSYAIAEKAVEKAGITVHEDFDGEFAAKVRTGPYEWSRMAGIQVGGPSND
ncbi:hypothetical protein [Streptomyces griseomycini]|uniref:Uncharacterized protein n=1 Tax=Streptomyces griseomycini TaxID=66895 RepID=A0A7W7PN77_9ACTN|nr:hypothetical protein [Streptomyces griseomycini]MBB4896134.1 hypothetical protein [Streptomyces griseomycini]GGQ22826.1 hypothetical protein GCM10010266_52440 [Streptomyces griseomycini]GGR39540.1 hypothetical protein GCM10015536_51600 [Streptomyces griseomycini]